MKKIILIFILFISILSFSKSNVFTSDGTLNSEKLLEKSWNYGSEGLPTLNLSITKETNNKYYGSFKTENGKNFSKQEMKIYKNILLQDEVGYCYGYDINLERLVVVDPEDMKIIFISFD